MAHACRAHESCPMPTTRMPNRTTMSTARSRPSRPRCLFPRAKAQRAAPDYRLCPGRDRGADEGAGVDSVQGHNMAADDPYFITAPWVDATLLPAPTNSDALPAEGKFRRTRTALMPPACRNPGLFGLRMLIGPRYCPACPSANTRSVAGRSTRSGQLAQPMPRPFKKSGHAAIESVIIKVKK